MDIARIAFERGISIRRDDDASGDRWILESSEDQRPVTSPEQVAERYGVRPVVAFEITKLVGERASLFRTDGQLMWDYYREYFQTYLQHSTDMFHHKRNLDHTLGALTYHCERLAKLYARICSHFAGVLKLFTKPKSLVNFSMIGSSLDPPIVYYELEALITEARRSYDATRHILWRQFGPGKGNYPNSFAKILPRCDRLPDGLRERLSTSWSTFGERLADYRDCLMHYPPIKPVNEFAQMKQLEAGIWSVSFWLPDNPESRSSQKFEFRSCIDGLTYGWELTQEVLDISKAIVDEVQNPTVP